MIDKAGNGIAVRTRLSNLNNPVAPCTRCHKKFKSFGEFAHDKNWRLMCNECLRYEFDVTR